MILKHCATKGGRYSIELVQTTGAHGAILYDIVFKTRGKVTGSSCNYPSLDLAQADFAKRINMARCIDGINYQDKQKESE